MQETQVPSLIWEDPLEKEMAAHSSILAWEILWTEGPGELQSMGLQRVAEHACSNDPILTCLCKDLESESSSLVSNSLRPHALYSP